ncbi:MAG: hypothetical protein AABY22_29205, partial [Nanoarchaeota archaeon]
TAVEATLAILGALIAVGISAQAVEIFSSLGAIQDTTPMEPRTQPAPAFQINYQTQVKTNP